MRMNYSKRNTNILLGKQFKEINPLGKYFKGSNKNYTVNIFCGDEQKLHQ